MTDALGMIECRSFPAVVEAADAAVKAAQGRAGVVREDRRRLRVDHRPRRRGGREGRHRRRADGGRPRGRSGHGARHRAPAHQRRHGDAAGPRRRREGRQRSRRPCSCAKSSERWWPPARSRRLDGLKLMLVRQVDTDGRETGGFVDGRRRRRGRARRSTCSSRPAVRPARRRPPTIARSMRSSWPSSTRGRLGGQTKYKK